MVESRVVQREEGPRRHQRHRAVKHYVAPVRHAGVFEHALQRLRARQLGVVSVALDGDVGVRQVPRAGDVALTEGVFIVVNVEQDERRIGRAGREPLHGNDDRVTRRLRGPVPRRAAAKSEIVKVRTAARGNDASRIDVAPWGCPASADATKRMRRDERGVESLNVWFRRHFPDMNPYKQTLFDRHGPDAAQLLQALGLGLLVFGVTSGALLLQIGFHWWELPVGAGAGALSGSFGWLIGEAVGGGWRRAAVDGSSTPYERQFSYEQSLVMKGRVDDALASFEAVIATEPELIAPRTKAADSTPAKRKTPSARPSCFATCSGPR